MKELEKRGVATVALVADTFVDDHKRSAESMGIPGLPYARMPHPFVNQEPELIRGMVEVGLDAVTVALTTAPRSDLSTSTLELLTDPWLSFEGPDLLAALDAMNQRFLELRYSDGLPLMPATRQRLEWMLSGTSRDRDEILGLLEPGDGVATIEKVAINALMAGCQPRHLPIVIAAIECLIDPQMGLRRKAISTAPSAPMVIVNGEARLRAGLNHGPCMLGPGSPSVSNIAIGRAVRLSMMNVGHTYPGISEMDTIGSPNKFSLCVAENEEHSPWTPYHVERGSEPNSSSVTVSFLYGLSDLQDFKSTEPETAIRKFATGAQYMGVNSTGHWLTGRREDPRFGVQEQEHHFILMAPEHTKIFTRAGWDKARIREALFKKSRLPFGFLSGRLEQSAIRIGHPELDWLFDSPDALVPVLESPDCFDIVVAGSPGSNRSAFGWGMGGPVTKPVAVDDIGA